MRRILSFVAVALCLAWLWTLWNQEKTIDPAPHVPQQDSFASNTPTPHSFNGNTTSAATQPIQSALKPQRHQMVHIHTDTLDLEIAPQGGQIVAACLVQYPQSHAQSNQAILLLSDQEKLLTVARSGFVSDTRSEPTDIQYSTEHTEYVLGAQQNDLKVVLSGTTQEGLHITKSFQLRRGSYRVNVNYSITNNGNVPYSGSFYNQFLHAKPEKTSGFLYSSAYEGASVSSPERPYYKLTYDAIKKSSFESVHPGGWVALQMRYFVMAWLPPAGSAVNRFDGTVRWVEDKPIYEFNIVGKSLSIAPKQTIQEHSTLYLGPAVAKDLAALAPGLDHTIDYGWLWWISDAIFWLMDQIHRIINNWGWTIIATTILIKLILYPLSAASFRSMSRMKELQPKMHNLRKQFAQDRQALSQATMELYRREKINPLGGCLPMLIQIPIFIALYYVIVESVELRMAPFCGWIHDLSIKDPYYVLPILMGLSMLIQQKLTPSSLDPTQSRMMMIIPIVFTVFFLNFPAGLTLYWLVNNCVQIVQQWYVARTTQNPRS